MQQFYHFTVEMS